MNRNSFLKLGGLWVAGFLLNNQLMAMQPTPLTYYFDDDGLIPNSKYPLLVYKNVFADRGQKGGDWLQRHFANNQWTNTWRWGVYPFHHYHSNTHEVLGCFSGNALLHMGGELGKKITIEAGDIVVIPAGVGHKCISASDDFTVLGAYPYHLSPDLKRGDKRERPEADVNIAAVKCPITDPYTGNVDGLTKLWNKL